jgi:rhodanese-related sulfurtransferase
LRVSRKLLSLTIIAVVIVQIIYYLQIQDSHEDISIEQARHLIEAKPNLVIVDVRTQEEYATGYIVGAINLCVECDPQLLLDNLNPNDEILLYCKTGRRSANALRILKDNGFEKISNMVGGITAWRNADYPLVES